MFPGTEQAWPNRCYLAIARTWRYQLGVFPGREFERRQGSDDPLFECPNVVGGRLFGADVGVDRPQQAVDV